MTAPDNAYELAMELQSLTFDMSMLENLRASAFELRHQIEMHEEEGVYVYGGNARRMISTVNALKKLEGRCDDAITAMSKREQEVVWELSGKNSEVPSIRECPFCGGEARVFASGESYYSTAIAFIECSRCEDVSSPLVRYTEYCGMCNPWRLSNRKVLATEWDARIEATADWNRRIYGGKAVPVKIHGCTECDVLDGNYEARPCPLCGGEPVMRVNEVYYPGVWDAQMICTECGMTGPRAYGIDTAQQTPALELCRAEYPNITILDSRKAAFLTALGGWNHRAYGREAGQ